MSSYWANFTKTGDPNGTGLSKWPLYKGAQGAAMMHFGEEIQAVPQAHRERYQFWSDAPDKAAAH